MTAGVTTTHNWAHNVRSPAHADAEVRAMRDSGLRGRFAYGPALGMPNDKPMDLADMARLKRDVGKDDMLTVGMCSRNIDGNNTARGAVDAAMATKEWSARARDRPADHAAHQWQRLDPAARRRQFARQGRAARPSARTLNEKDFDSRWPSTARTTAYRRWAKPVVPARCNLPS